MTIRRALTLKTGTFSRFQFGDREHEAVGKKNCIRNNHSKSPHSPTAILSVRKSSIVKSIKKPSGQLHNIETEVKNMAETTYENLTRRIDRINAEMREIGEKNGISRLSLLASQTKSIKEDLSRLLWIELPELNASHKIEAVSKSTTGMFFHPGIFEMDAMRQAFFKRQAKHFFDNEAEQQAYIEYAEKEYLEATITLKDILFNSKNANQKVSKDHLIEQFEEAMQ